MRISSLSSSKRIFAQPVLRQQTTAYFAVPVLRGQSTRSHYATTPTSSWTDESRVWEKDPKASRDEHLAADRKPRDVTEELTAEHRAIEDLIKRAMSEVATGSRGTAKDTSSDDQGIAFSAGFLDQEFPPRVEPKTETTQQTSSIREQARDSAIQEMINRLQSYCSMEATQIYPLVRDKVPAGGYLHDKALAEQAEVKNTLNRVSDYMKSHTGKDYTGFPKDQLSHLLHTFKDHTRGLETEVFPKLKSALSYSDLSSLAEKIERARRTEGWIPSKASPQRSSASMDDTSRAFQESSRVL